MVWNTHPDLERADLGVSLAESGTGIGQVLAILYVVLNSDVPQIILIDEPQSFLHPGAVRKLISILKEHQARLQHQFIIATHSPTVITAADPATITNVRLENGRSVLGPINPRDAASLQICLVEIGARLGDVFGVDNILWVEGDTEEICFPKILEKIAKKPLMGTAILALSRTGDLEGRHAELVLDIYNRLSASNSLLPPAIGFILDRECRTQQQQEELSQRSHGSVFFTGRRMYENYLLNPVAIASVANGIADFRAEPITEEEVRQAMDRKRQESRYYCDAHVDSTSDQWIDHINGARLLKDLFNELSETRVAYRKVEHSLLLTEWLIEHSPADLQELADLLAPCLPSSE